MVKSFIIVSGGCFSNHPECGKVVMKMRGFSHAGCPSSSLDSALHLGRFPDLLGEEVKKFLMTPMAGRSS